MPRHRAIERRRTNNVSPLTYPLPAGERDQTRDFARAKSHHNLYVGRWKKSAKFRTFPADLSHFYNPRPGRELGRTAGPASTARGQFDCTASLGMMK